MLALQVLADPSSGVVLLVRQLWMGMDVVGKANRVALVVLNRGRTRCRSRNRASAEFITPPAFPEDGYASRQRPG
jgi:hypothetical protein